jgi:hypothetical protein
VNLRNACAAVGLLLTALGPQAALAQSADYVYLPPQPLAKETPAAFEAALAAPYPVYTLALPKAQRAGQLAAKAGTPWVIGSGLNTTLESADLFGQGLTVGPGLTYVAALTVPGAAGLRVQADLAGLGAGDELWVGTPGGETRFGPYTVRESLDGPRWLPTVFAESCVLILRAPADSLPVLRITAVSNLDADPRKEFPLPCPTPVACATDPLVPQLASGVGLILITFQGVFGQPLTVACTGALVNNPLTETLEPFLLSADHCFDADADLRDAEVIWDQRFATCNADGVPPDTTLRSRGARLLVTSPRNDVHLMALDQVPVGPYGRAWLGWDAAPAVPGETVLAVHHPLGAPLALAEGVIDATGLDSVLGRNQTEVTWQQGFTESGSSGSPALLPDRGYRVFGALSNGNLDPGCGSETGNIDRYGTMALFFPRAAPYLYSAQPPDEAAEPEPDLCPIALIFGREVEITRALRAWRDTTLAGSTWGEAWIAAYRDWSPRGSAAVAASPEARALVGAAVLPFAWWAGAFDGR